MKLIKWLISNETSLPLLILVIFALLAGRTLLTPGYFWMHDDLHVMRQFEMEKCFNDFQIPCRWVPDMGYGFGFPLFNYYPPLPYLTGELFRLAGFSFIKTAKLLFLIPFIFSGISMFFFSNEFFGRWGGLLSSIFYIWAPYLAVDVYVRGAMNEAWAFIWFPLILWTSYKLLICEKNNSVRWIVGLALSWAGLFLTHNLMVLIFFPVFVLWVLFFLLREKKWEKLFVIIRSGVLALGLTAFFTLPAILEQKYVQIDTLVNGYFNYMAHFATFGQLLVSRFWGYGASDWGEADGMSFQIGHFHWILSLIVIGIVLINIAKTKKKTKNIYLILLFFILVGWFAAFMAHSKSTFIWQALPPLKFVQFPWRFLTLVTFSFSFLAGSLVIFVPKKFVFWMVGLYSIGLIVLNWNFFLPVGGTMVPLTDAAKFSGAAWDYQRTEGISDFLPKTVMEIPNAPKDGLIEIMGGKAEIINSIQKSNWAKFQIVVSKEALVRINIFEFPNWKAFIDDKETIVTVPETEEWGRMYITVPEGSHEVYLKLFNTSLRTSSNLLSMTFWLGLLGYLILQIKIPSQ